MTDQETIIKAAMSILGSRTSKRKAESSRANGKRRKKKVKNKRKRKVSEAKSDWAKRYSTISSSTRNGTIRPARTRRCEDCGAAATQRHHEDYSKPLDVVYLCRKCHVLRHKEKGDPIGRPKGSKNKLKLGLTSQS